MLPRIPRFPTREGPPLAGGEGGTALFPTADSETAVLASSITSG